MERDKYGSQEIDDHHPNSEQEDVHDEKRSIDNRSALDDPAVVVVAQDHPPKKKWPIAFPPFAQCRKPIKSAIAMLIAILMTLSDKCRAAFGQTSLLAAIALVFYSPSRTVGVTTEDVILGTLAALISSGYSLLGLCYLSRALFHVGPSSLTLDQGAYLANLTRDPSIRSPVQPGSSGVLAVFLFVGTFTIAYIRLKVTRLNITCIIPSILMAFSMTESSVVNGFQPSIVWLLFKPLAAGGAIAIGVSALIWPDDSVTNYMAVLDKTLSGYNAFFKEHSNAFQSASPSLSSTTLPSLHDRLHGTILALIDSKRAVHREIMLSRLSGQDISELTRIVKDMRPSLHGIGLGQILRARAHDLPLDDDDDEQADAYEDRQMLLDAFSEVRAAFQEISDTCVRATSECIERLKRFDNAAGRSTLSSILWPFPKILNINHPIRRRRQQQSQAAGQKPISSSQLDETVGKLDAQVGQLLLATVHADKTSTTRLWHFRGIHLLSMYRYNLREYCARISELLRFVEHLERTRTTRRMRFPTAKSLRKRFQNSENIGVDPHLGGEPHEYGQQSPGLSLVRTNTRHDHHDALLVPSNDIRTTTTTSPSSPVAPPPSTTKKKMYHRDPDVDPPATPLQRFWYSLYRVRTWFIETDTFFAFKTAAGTVLLALPAFLAQSASWYMQWRGQWALIVLMLWMFPMTGMFFYTIMMRIVGTAIGGILGIVVWEISRGNPYGLAVLMFFVLCVLYHVLMYKPVLRMVAILTIVTLLLVIIYEYNYTQSGSPNYDKIYTVAGKRMLLVLIGFVASAILSMIPYPVAGRVELRKRLAQTLRDIGKMYGILTFWLITPSIATQEFTQYQLKSFRKLAVNVRRQIEDEHTFLKLSVFEPPLRGKFPAAKYRMVLEKVDNMADLVTDMAFVFPKIDQRSLQHIAATLTNERRDYLASIMTTLKLLSTTLAAKMALPPYFIAPDEARTRFSRELQRKITVRTQDIDNRSFQSYSSYIVTSLVFVDELQQLLKVVEDLVGVENPEEWLRSHV